MQQPAAGRLTLDEYLAFEEQSPIPHEYRNGYAVALAAPSGTHGAIALNLTLAIGPTARSLGCDARAGDTKVVAPGGDRLIPDFLVTCDERDREALRRPGEALVAYPWLVIEILSPTTAAADMTDKLDAYSSISDVTHYVVIDSRRRAARAFERTPDGKFASSGPLDALTFARLGALRIPLEEIYRDTNVPRIEDVSPEV